MSKTVPAERDLTSIGCLCRRLDATMHEIERAIAKAKIVPAYRINGVNHYDAEQERTIRKHLRTGK